MRCPGCGSDTPDSRPHCIRCNFPLPAPPQPDETTSGDPTAVEVPVPDPPTETHTVLDPTWQPSNTPGEPGEPGEPRPWTPATGPTGGGRRFGGLGWVVAGTLAVALAGTLVLLWPGDDPADRRHTTASPAPTDTPTDTTSTPTATVTALGRRFWVQMFAPAGGLEGHIRPTTASGPKGTLEKGRHWVLCRRWGQRVSRTGNDGRTHHNHWWLLTHLDHLYGDGETSPRAWVPALYLTRWGDDEAKDDDGREIPVCPPGDHTG
ncbi:hypothetical protein GCM10009678_00800 [Actinomadura kijaniata]|uniref:Uncharacterized protein n=1 Tax=Actinomadura namibiensis TaxID=182080 RepID=A0A7W3LSE2_ACTNM|nr:hypothetical protein [Actinomadura namibiensis]MBA8953394.1 hypothetical protein [Actinomadura namibiensis]